MQELLGGCLCGNIRYRVTAQPKASVLCHCRDCQYISGGGPTPVIIISAEQLVIIRGVPLEFGSKSDSGSLVTRSFCGNCGSPLFVYNDNYPELRAVKAGSLDIPGIFEPGLSIWTGSAQRWMHLDGGVPQFPKNP